MTDGGLADTIGSAWATIVAGFFGFCGMVTAAVIALRGKRGKPPEDEIEEQIADGWKTLFDGLRDRIEELERGERDRGRRIRFLESENMRQQEEISDLRRENQGCLLEQQRLRARITQLEGGAR